MSDKPVLYCSFCAKAYDKVAVLIAGPTVFICDECVAVCNEIIAEQRIRKAVADHFAATTAAIQEGHRPSFQDHDENRSLHGADK